MRRIAAHVVFLTIFGSLLISCSRDPNVRKQKYFESGKKYFEKAQYHEAAIQFSNAVQVDPRFAEAHYELARTYIKLGALTTAYGELRRTVDLQPDNVPALLDLGNFLLAARQFAQAEKIANDLIAKHPDEAAAHALLANLFEVKGDTAGAMREISKAIELKPSGAQFHTNLGMFLARDKNYAGAEAEFKKSAELDPKLTAPLFDLAALYAAQNRLPEAEDTLKKAVSVAPQSVEPRIALSRFYLGQQKRDLAEQSLADAKKAMPGDPAAYRLLADYYVATGQLDKGLAEYKTLTDLHRSDLPLKKTYIAALLQKGNTAEATRLNDEILKKNSKDVEAQITRGRILLSEKKAVDALHSFDDALKMDRDNAAAHYFAATAAEMAGDQDRREKELRETVRLRPDYVEAQLALGNFAINKRDWDTAYSTGAVLIKTLPNSPHGYLLRAVAEANRHDVAAAESDMKRAIEVGPDNASGYVRLGELRISQQRYKEADQLMEQALVRDPNSADAMRMLALSNILQKFPPSRMIARLKAQLEKAPRNTFFYAMLGAAEAQVHDLEHARQHLEQALQIEPNNLTAMTVLAQVDIASGRTDEALATYQTWAKQNPKDPRPLALIGIIHDGQNRWQEAQDMYKKALDVAPEFAIAANNLAYSMLQHGGNADVALSLAQTAVRNMPDSPNVVDTMGWAYYQKGVYSSAIDTLEQAVRKEPSNAEFHYHLGMAYRKHYEREKAKAEFDKVLKLNPKFPQADQVRQELDTLQKG